MNDPEMTDLGRNFKGVPGFKRKHNIQKIKDLKRNKIKKTTATKYNIPNKKKNEWVYQIRYYRRKDE